MRGMQPSAWSMLINVAHGRVSTPTGFTDRDYGDLQVLIDAGLVVLTARCQTELTPAGRVVLALSEGSLFGQPVAAPAVRPNPDWGPRAHDR